LKLSFGEKGLNQSAILHRVEKCLGYEVRAGHDTCLLRTGRGIAVLEVRDTPPSVFHSTQPLAYCATATTPFFCGVSLEALGARTSREATIEAQYAGLERLEEIPHGCYDGWVYMGFEGEDENGEHVELVEWVPCRRCHLESL
jgi:hypothetical protein